MPCVKKEVREVKIDIKQQKYNVKQKLAQLKNKGKPVDLTKKPNAKTLHRDTDIEKLKTKINDLIKEFEGNWLPSKQKEMLTRWVKGYQTNIKTQMNSYRLKIHLQNFYSRLSELNERNTPPSQNTEIITKIDQLIEDIDNYCKD